MTDDIFTRLVDTAYRERNMLVAYLSKLYPSGVKKTVIEGWDECWHNCVYIDLPTGQASWHFHDNDKDLFDHLTEYPFEWNGHTTEEKYNSMNTLETKKPWIKGHSVAEVFRQLEERFGEGAEWLF